MSADKAALIVKAIEKMIAEDKEKDWADVLYMALLTVGEAK